MELNEYNGFVDHCKNNEIVSFSTSPRRQTLDNEEVVLEGFVIKILQILLFCF